MKTNGITGLVGVFDDLNQGGNTFFGRRSYLTQSHDRVNGDLRLVRERLFLVLEHCQERGDGCLGPGPDLSQRGDDGGRLLRLRGFLQGFSEQWDRVPGSRTDAPDSLRRAGQGDVRRGILEHLQERRQGSGADLAQRNAGLRGDGDVIAAEGVGQRGGSFLGRRSNPAQGLDGMSTRERVSILQDVDEGGHRGGAEFHQRCRRLAVPLL